MSVVDGAASAATGGRGAGGGTVATKRALLGVSRAVEQLAEACAVGAEPGEDVVVLALFERAEYFGFERARYAALADGATVIAGFAGQGDVPEGVHRLALPDDHELADQWTVLAVSPLACGGLVATDLDDVAPASSAERGRIFAARLSTDPAWVAGEIDRIVAAAGDLLDRTAAAELSRAAQAASTRVVGRAATLLGAQLETAWRRTLAASDRLEIAEHQAFTDPLTGARNRWFLERYLGRLGSRAPDIAVIAIDLDDFKALNDAYGHAVGDEALRAFAEVARAHIREGDVLVRMGGDEWLVLLPRAPHASARARAASILAALSDVRLPSAGGHPPLRASAGVGRVTAATPSLETVDAALYAAKRRGGGGVVDVPGAVALDVPPRHGL
ncbi:MAG: diguanylate cyclase [Egibacteraceae bacterium]